MQDSHRDDDFPRRRHLSGAPWWVKAFAWTGSLISLAGLGTFAVGVLGLVDEGPDLKLAIGLFLGGLVVSLIGRLGDIATRQR